MKFIIMGLSVFFCLPAISAEVIEEWNFTAGSLKSENGVNAGFFNGLSNSNPDARGTDWYNVTRGNGNSGNIALTGAPFTAQNTGKLHISVTLQEYDLSAGTNAYFAVRFRQSNTTVAEIRFNAANDKIQLNGSSIGGWLNGGNALTGVTSSEPVTYGLTLDFAGGVEGKGTYTLWLNAPDDSGWSWINRYKSYTGDIDLSDASVDAVQWGIQEGAAGDRFGIDRIKIFRTESAPTTMGFVQ